VEGGGWRVEGEGPELIDHSCFAGGSTPL